MVFQEATSEAAGKAKKPTAWHLMPHKNYLGNRVAIFRSVIARCLTLANIGRSPFTLQYLFMFSASVFNRIRCQFICCCLSVVIRLLDSCFYSNSLVSVQLLLFLFLFWSLCFVWLFIVWLFDYSVSFSVLILYSRYFNPQILFNYQPTGKSIHHTPDCAIFCLGIGSKSLLQSLTFEDILNQFLQSG